MAPVAASPAPRPADALPLMTSPTACRESSNRHGDDWIDEIPDAYKDIDLIMADAADLVGVEHTLRQMLNLKGT